MRHCKSSWLLNSQFKAALTLEAKEDDRPEVKTVKSALRILFETAWQGTIPVFKAAGNLLTDRFDTQACIMDLCQRLPGIVALLEWR